MQVKTDANLYPLNETAKRTPMQASASVSVAASSTDSATITIPDGEMWFIKSWTITKGADITVDSITIDSKDTYETTSVSDTESRYGAVLNAVSQVFIQGTNAAISAENLEIQVDGYKIVF